MLGLNLLCYIGVVVNGWFGMFFFLDYLEVYFEFFCEGVESVGCQFSDFDFCVLVCVEIGDDVEGMINCCKQGVVFNMGGMGLVKINFYNVVFQCVGYEEDVQVIQLLWIEGKCDEVMQCVFDVMVIEFQVLGMSEMVRE